MAEIRSRDQITILDITDGYSVSLSSESYTFVGNTMGINPNSQCSTDIAAFCGSTPCTLTVNQSEVTTADPNGNTVANVNIVVENGTSQLVKVKVSNSKMIPMPFEVVIPVHVHVPNSISGDTVEFIKKFSISYAKMGSQGNPGDKGDKGDTGDKGDKGDPGAPGQQGNPGISPYSLTVSCPSGNVFKNSSGTKTLTAVLYQGTTELTIASNGTVSGHGIIKWYINDEYISSSNSLNVSASSITDWATIECRLEQ